MINGFKVITLCGSTRFKEEFLEAQKRLTLEGNIVISVGLFGHSGDDVVWTEGVKDMLDRQHLSKIDLADEIFVINVGGYIGDSTRREIAYAEYKGKSISYLEESRKPCICEKSIAIEELHDSGKLSDEDWEKASDDLAEKREAASAEYNACQGPWPYQWNDADVVVCGILQRFGLVSCDFNDLKYLYEADSIYEIRIKGKGTNEEEQVQSIIDTIRNEYMDLLQSSKKLAVTIIDSNRAAYFGKIADCLSGMDVIWHEWGATAEEEVIELSIVVIMETNLQFKLKGWSQWALESYLSEVKRVGENVATSFYNQSDLSRVKDCELMIIGINPGCGKEFSQWELKDRVLSNSDFLYWGNPCFQGLSDKDIIFEMSQKYDKDKRRYGWDLWHKIHKMLDYTGKGELLEKPDKFVLTNMVFFGTAHQGQIPKEIDQEFCAKKTLELIDILKPKVVLLLGDQTRDLFKKVANISHMEELIPQSISYCFYKEKFHVLSIKHTAYRYSSYEMKIIGNAISYAIDNNSKSLEKNLLYQTICKEANGRAWYLKAMISNNGSKQNIYNEKTVYHEFYTKQIEGKWISSNDRIVIDLTPEDNKNQYAVLVFTRQNDAEITKKIIQGIWPNEEFNPWECDKSRHVHEVISFEVSNEEIKSKIEKVLQEVKTYRDKEYPLK